MDCGFLLEGSPTNSTPHRSWILALAALMAPIGLADGVTGGPRIQLGSGTNWVSSSPWVASSPLGQSCVVQRVTTMGGTSLTYAIFDPAGQLAVPPTPVPIGLLAPVRCRVAASTLGFLVVFSATGGSDGVGSGIYYWILDHSGAPTMGAPARANVWFDRDEDWPGAVGLQDGGFALVWTRAWSGVFGSSEGVFARRVDILGTPMDSIELRVDDPSVARGHQRAAAVGSWPSGRLVVVWQDGAVGSPLGSPAAGDGFGSTIRARWIGPMLALLGTGDQVVPSSTDRDQLDPYVATDHRDRCVIGWTHETTATRTDAACRPFLHDGTPLLPDEIVTVDCPTSKLLTAVTMSPSGEHALAWMDINALIGVPNVLTLVELRRYTSARTTIETVALGTLNELNGSGSLSSDQFGNLVVAFRSSVPSASSSISFQQFRRNMVRFSAAGVSPGTSVGVTLDSPSDPDRIYQVLMSASAGFLFIDTRWVKVAADSLLLWSVFGGGSGVLQGGVGQLNATGVSSQPSVSVPAIASLTGLQLQVSFVTYDPNAPSLLNTISDVTVLPIL